MRQGVYYYFYQVFRNRAEATALARKKKGLGDGSVGMFASLLVAAFAGYNRISLCKFVLYASFWSVTIRIRDYH